MDVVHQSLENWVLAYRPPEILLRSPLRKTGSQGWAAVSNLELKNQNENVTITQDSAPQMDSVFLLLLLFRGISLEG